MSGPFKTNRHRNGSGNRTKNSDAEAAPSDAEPPASPVAPVVPPTQPAALVSAIATTVWPGLIGILAIILGTVGAVVSGWNSLRAVQSEPPYSEFAGRGVASSQTDPWSIALVAIPTLSLIVYMTSIIGGVNLLRRRPLAPRILQCGAVAFGVLAIANILVQMSARTDHVQRMSPNGRAGTINAGIIDFNLAVVLSAGILLSFLVPTFVLLWFRRRKIREEVATWA